MRQSGGFVSNGQVEAERPERLILKTDRTRLEELLRGGGVQQTRVVLRALALRQLAAGDSAPQIAKRLPLTAQTIRNLARRYEHEGLERALHEKERPVSRCT